MIHRREVEEPSGGVGKAWRRVARRAGVAAAGAALVALLTPRPAGARSEPAPTAALEHRDSGSAEDGRCSECLECHSGNPSEDVLFPDGSALPIGVDATAWQRSAHGDRIGCTACHRHRAYLDYPHGKLDFPNAREYQIAQSAVCKRCHYAYANRVLDGIHYAQLEEGNREAPTCADCHGAHQETHPDELRVEVDRRCARCHEEVAAAYVESVHGRALTEGDQDLPLCADCHGAHGILDPRSIGFHVGSHEICARCHGDAERMEPYGLNPYVLDSYLNDFHGESNQLYAAGAGEPGRPMATCTDCHGIHSIHSLAGDGDPDEVRDRVIAVCRGCHENSSPAFADAWLSHYAPTLRSAPLVWGIQWIYRILIPFILLGLVLHILLDLWRATARH